MAVNEAGKVAIRVSPDTKGFAKELKEQLDKIEAEYNAKNPFKVEVTPELDQTAFDKVKAKLDELKEDIRVNVQADADTAKAKEKIDELKASLDDTRNKVRIQVDADTARAQEKLDDLSVNRAVNVQATADTTAAEAALARVARDRTATIHASVDSNGLSTAIKNAVKPQTLKIGWDEKSLTSMIREMNTAISTVNRAGIKGFSDMAVGIHDSLANVGRDFSEGIGGAATSTLSGLRVTFTGLFDAVANNFKTVRAGIGTAVKGISSDLLGAAGGWEGVFATMILKAGSAAKAVGGLAATYSGLGIMTDVAKYAIDVFRNFDEVAISAGKIVTIGGSVVGSIGAMSAGLLSLASSLSQLAPLALALPGALEGGAAAMFVFKTALSQAGTYVPGVASSLKDLQASIAPTFWQQAASAVNQLSADAMPVLQTAMTGLATSAGNLTAAFAKSFDTPANIGAMKTVLDNTASALDILSQKTSGWVDAFSQLSVVGSTYLPQLATWLGNCGDKFNAFITASAQSGALTQWINNAIQQLKYLFSIAGDVIGVFGSLFKAANMSGSNGLKSLADDMNRLNQVLKTDSAQTALTEFFYVCNQGAAQVGDAFGRLAGAIGSNWDTITHVISNSATTVSSVLDGISAAITNPKFASGLSTLSDGFRDFVGSLSSVGSEIGDLFGDKLQVAGALLKGLGVSLAAAIQVITPLVDSLVNSFQPLTEALGPTLAKMIQDTKPVFDELAKFFDNLKPSIQNFADKVLPALEQAWNALMPALKDFVATVGPGINHVIDALSDALPKILPVVSAILTIEFKVIAVAVRIAIDAIAAAITVIGDIYGAIAGFINFIKPGGTADQALQSFVDAIGNVISGAVNFFKEGFQQIGDAVKAVWDFFAPGGTGDQILQGFFDAIGGIISGGINFFKEGFQQIIDVVKTVWNFFAPGGEGDQIVNNFFSTIGNAIATGAVAIATWFANGFVGVWNTVSTWFVNLATSVAGWLAGVWTTVTTWFASTAADFSGWLTGVWTSISTWFTNLVTGVATWLAGIWTSVTTWLATLPGSISAGLVAAWTAITTWFTNLWTTVSTTVSSMVTDIVTWFTTLGTNVSVAVSTLVSSVTSFFSNLWSTVTTTVSNLVTDVGNFFSNMASNAVTAVSNLVSNVISGISNMASNVANGVSNMVSNVLNYFSNMAGNAASAVSNMVSNIASTIGGLWGRVSGAVSGFVNNFINTIGQMPSQAASALSGLGSAMVGAISGVASQFEQIGSNIIHGLINGITGAIGAAVSAVTGAVGSIVSAAQHALDSHSPSRVFMKIGRYIPQGLAIGIGDEDPLLKSATKAMVATVVNNSTPVVTPSMGSNEANAATAGIVFNNYPQYANPKSPTRDAQEFVNSFSKNLSALGF